ncbi:MAG TPA: glycoside-pentoside-hexuronide (GPH):cation symporter [Myxococcaceae bacterium]|nr:glycoside-pentoside-hexuronide (GPH):cation symporter [Myxococcaceae bacterium]
MNSPVPTGGSRSHLGRRVLLGFGLGSLGTGIYSSVPSVLLLYFMTDMLGIEPGLAGLGMFLPKMWDVITDPLMGVVSDRTRSRWGRRRPYLLVGALAMGVTFVFLFSVPELDTASQRFLYVTVIYTLSATAYTLYAVPYIAMPAEMSEDPHERTVSMSYRMGFALAGILIGSAVAPLAAGWFGGGREGYARMSLAVGGFCVVTMLAAFFGTSRVPMRQHVDLGLGLREQVLLVMRNRPFLVLLGNYLLLLTGTGVLTAVVPYFVVHVLGEPAEKVGMVFLSLMLTAIVSMPLWSWLSRSLGKKGALAGAVVVLSAGCLTLLGTGPGYPAVALYLQLALMGVGFAGAQLLPFSMLTDTIQLDTQHSGMNREGLFTGMWTAGEKTGLALGPLLTGALLSWSGFVESSGAALVQTESARLGIKLTFAVLPPLLLLSSLLVLRAYRLHIPGSATGSEPQEAAGARVAPHS